MESSSRSSLQGLRVISFESRRAKEMAELIRRHGGEPIVAPSMREVALSENSAPLELFQKIEAGQIDLVILLTGVGTRTMVDALAIHYSRERIAALLGKVTLLARGPKPVAALKELGLQPAIYGARTQHLERSPRGSGFQYPTEGKAHRRSRIWHHQSGTNLGTRGARRGSLARASLSLGVTGEYCAATSRHPRDCRSSSRCRRLYERDPGGKRLPSGATRWIGHEAAAIFDTRSISFHRPGLQRSTRPLRPQA